MRRIFSEREIDDYIKGGNVTDIDSLETNPYFIAAIIRKTKDYNIYAVKCNDKMKISPIIMKTMLEVFGNKYLENDSKSFYRGLNILSRKSDNIDNYYSNKPVVTTQFLEILILLVKTSPGESDLLSGYFEKDIKSYTDEFGVLNDDCNGLFKELSCKYNSDIIQEFIAVKLTDKIINDIFYDGIDTLSYNGIENIVHDKITDKELLDKEMVICSIISCIAEADMTLANYLGNHKELLAQYGEYAESYYDHWDSYESDRMFNTVDSFVSVVRDYTIKHQLDVSSNDVVRAIGKKLNIENIFDDYYTKLAEKEKNNKIVEASLELSKVSSETYRDLANNKRAENMVNNDSIFKPLVSLAKRTFITTEHNKVLSLSSPITGETNNN